MNLLAAPTDSPVTPRVILRMAGVVVLANAAFLAIGGWNANIGGGLVLMLALAAEALERQAMWAERPVRAWRWRAAKLLAFVVSAALIAVAFYERWGA